MSTHIIYCCDGGKTPLLIFAAPFAPQNFRVTGEDVVGVNMIRYVMEWDVIVPGVSYEYNQVEFTVTPEPVSRQKSIVSPMWIIFTTSTEYEVMLRFGNCVGSNSSTLRFVTSEYCSIQLVYS